jgi:hypothetical protein
MMHVSVTSLLVASLLLAQQLARADAGGGDLDGGSEDVFAVACDGESECSEGPAEAATPAVVACDGGLCDTLQGRPSCTVTADLRGDLSGVESLGAVTFVCAVFLARRARRGARRPARDRRACQHAPSASIAAESPPAAEGDISLL